MGSGVPTYGAFGNNPSATPRPNYDTYPGNTGTNTTFNWPRNPNSPGGTNYGFNPNNNGQQTVRPDINSYNINPTLPPPSQRPIYPSYPGSTGTNRTSTLPTGPSYRDTLISNGNNIGHFSNVNRNSSYPGQIGPGNQCESTIFKPI